MIPANSIGEMPAPLTITRDEITCSGEGTGLTYTIFKRCLTELAQKNRAQIKKTFCRLDDDSRLFSGAIGAISVIVILVAQNVFPQGQTGIPLTNAFALILLSTLLGAISTSPSSYRVKAQRLERLRSSLESKSGEIPPKKIPNLIRQISNETDQHDAFTALNYEQIREIYHKAPSLLNVILHKETLSPTQQRIWRHIKELGCKFDDEICERLQNPAAGIAIVRHPIILEQCLKRPIDIDESLMQQIYNCLQSAVEKYGRINLPEDVLKKAVQSLIDGKNIERVIQRLVNWAPRNYLIQLKNGGCVKANLERLSDQCLLLDEVDLKEEDPDLVKTVIAYLMTGELNLNFDDFLEIAALAYRLGAIHLSDRCAEFAKKHWAELPDKYFYYLVFPESHPLRVMYVSDLKRAMKTSSVEMKSSLVKHIIDLEIRELYRSVKRMPLTFPRFFLPDSIIFDHAMDYTKHLPIKGEFARFASAFAKKFSEMLNYILKNQSHINQIKDLSKIAEKALKDNNRLILHAIQKNQKKFLHILKEALSVKHHDFLLGPKQLSEVTMPLNTFVNFECSEQLITWLAAIIRENVHSRKCTKACKDFLLSLFENARDHQILLEALSEYRCLPEEQDAVDAAWSGNIPSELVLNVLDQNFTLQGREA